VKREKELEPEYDELLDDSCGETLNAMVGRHRATSPVLVFCSDSALEQLVEEISGVTVLELVTDYKVLTEIERADDSGMHRVFATAKENSMRGLDFRAPSLGMVLIVDSAFSSPRDRSQGLSRVGRFGDDCTRVKLGTFDDVDMERSTAIWTRLLRLENAARKMSDFYDMGKMIETTENKRKEKCAAKEKARLAKLVPLNDP